MATTTFVDRQTPIMASWLNEVNTAVHGNGFTATGIGAIARAIQAKNSDLVDVADFGVTPGTGTSQSAAIANAVAACSAGKTLYFSKPGMYTVAAQVVDAAIVLPIGVNLEMAPGAWLTATTSFGSFIAPLGRNRIRANIDGAGYPLTGGIPGTWVLENVGIRAYFSTPIGLGATDVTVEGCHIKNVDFGLQIVGSQRWIVTGNHITRTKNSGILAGGTTALPLRHNLFSDNVFEEHGDTAIALYQLDATAEVAYNVMANNTAKNTQYRTNGYAFDVEAGTLAGYLHHNSIVGNTVEQTLTSSFTVGAVTMGNFCEYSLIASNVCFGNGGTSATASPGINIPRSKSVSVIGNYVERFSGCGISLDGSTDANIVNNTVRDCGGTTAALAGIRVTLGFSTTRPSLRGNHLSWSDGYAQTNAAAAAIAGFTATGITLSKPVIRDNHIHNAMGVGIQLAGITTVRIDGAVVADNTLVGGGALFAGRPVEVTFCDRASVSGNVLNDVALGIAATSCTLSNVSGNVLRNTIASTLPSYVDITGSTDVIIDNNDFRANAVTAPISPASQLTTPANNNRANGNRGIVTEADGITAAIATGATVTHGLSVTPTVVQLTAQDGVPTAVFPSALGATTFVVNFAGGGARVFAWSAKFR